MRESKLNTVIASLLWSLTALVFFLTFRSAEASFFGVIFAILAVTFAPKLAKSDWKTTPVIMLLSFVGLGLYQLFQLGLDSNTLSVLLGPQVTLNLFWCLQASVLSFFGIFCLRFLSLRNSGFLSLELIAIGLTCIYPFLGHRNGQWSMPRFFVDPLWSENIFPFPYFIAIGGILAVMFLGLSLSNSRKKRVVRDGFISLAVIVLLFQLLPFEDIHESVRQIQELGGKGQSGSESEQASQDSEGGQSSEPKDEMDFEADENQQSPSPVAVVILKDDYKPSLGAYYFRANAQSRYNGIRLVGNDNNPHDVDLLSYFPSGSQQFEDPLTPETQGLFTTVTSRIGLITQQQRPAMLVEPQNYRSVVNPSPKTFKRVYEVTSSGFSGDLQELFRSPIGNQAWPQATWDYYTQAPEDPRFQQLAVQCIQNLPGDYQSHPLAQAWSIIEYLSKQGKYTLRKRPPSDTPIEDFVFGDLTGYCVHFSQSAVTLMRSVGIPSRVGTGYCVEVDEIGSTSNFVIMGRHAHAWPEVYIQGIGWFPLDVSPLVNLDEPKPGSDPQLGNMFGELARDTDQRLSPEIDKPNKFAPLFKALRWIGVITLLFLFITPFIWKWSRYFEFFGPASNPYRNSYLSCLERLASSGITRRYGETRRAFATRLKQPEFSRLSQAFDDWPYRNPDESHIDHELGKQARQALTQELEQSIPWWRRLLGFFDITTLYHIQ